VDDLDATVSNEQSLIRKRGKKVVEAPSSPHSIHSNPLGLSPPDAECPKTKLILPITQLLESFY